MTQELKTFTPEELAAFDGKDGRPAYVAYDGKVVDVTGSKIWKGGRHMNRHQAGADMSADLAQAPHKPDVLLRYPQVGVLAPACDTPAAAAAAQAAATQAAPGSQTQAPPAAAQAAVHAQAHAAPDSELPWLLRAVPFLQRHPHPMTVHFPIAFSAGAVLFLALYVLTGKAVFADGVYDLMLAGALFTPVAILTGLATWKYNYGAAGILPVRIKLILSPVLFAQYAAGAAWWLADPSVLSAPGFGQALYGLLVLSTMPVMGVIGWFGAGLTFPLHK
uniref:Cytochrome b5 n=1 Tax=Fundidesulfovibrio putealis TaxID=270496 RepID=A0A7C4EJF8_9BACT